MSKILSKEDILDKHYESGMHWKSVNRNNILNAMKEYADIVAREMSIGFKIWADGRKRDINPATDVPYSTRQLYDKYLDHLNSIKK